MPSEFSNSHYIERYMELKIEEYELSCFDLTSNQLNLIAYIGRSSDNQRTSKMMAN